MKYASVDDLRRYGFARGKRESYCVTCNRLFEGGALPNGKPSFKCRPCAIKQWCEVEDACVAIGISDGRGGA
jgi:hypothetical protein